jgi:radical SAM protein with 4Fe4S-binding SPASM domain
MWKGIFRFVKFGEKNPPKLLMLSPTDFCNLDCKICWRRRKDATFHQPSSKFLKSIIKEAGNLGVETIDLTGGGEPLLRKDILELMRLVKKYEMKGIMTTNSTLLKDSYIKRIVRMGWDELNFSLDGSSAKINDHIRGEGIFDSVVKKIKLINRVKEEEQKKKPILRLSFVITKFNLNDIPNFVQLAKELKVQTINFSILFEWETNREFWLKNVKENMIRDILTNSLKLAKKNRVRTNLDSILKFGLGEHEPPKFCFAPWYMLFINANKEAMACCTFASLYQNILGTVDNLKEIWFGEKMEKFRNRMKKKMFFKECKKCIPEFAQMFNDMYEEMIRWNSGK